MQGHQGPVTSLALSRDGKTLASSSWDRTVRLWDADMGKELRPTEGSQHGLWSVALSPDGKQAATGGEDGAVRLWDSATGKESHRVLGPDSSRGLIDHLDFSPDGKTLTAATYGYTRFRWDSATGKPLGERVYKGIGLVATPDGKYVVGSDFGAIFLQDAATAKVIREFKGQKQSAKLAISPDGEYLACGSPEDNGTVVLWELATGKERCRCKGAPHRAEALAFSPDGKFLAGVTSNTRVYTPENSIYLWDTATGREMRQFRGTGHSVTCLAYSSDGRTIVSGGAIKPSACGRRRRERSDCVSRGIRVSCVPSPCRRTAGDWFR